MRGLLVPATSDVPALLTLHDVAAYLRIHYLTAWSLAKRGMLPGRKVGGQWRFRKDVVDAWLAAQMAPTPRSS